MRNKIKIKGTFRSDDYLRAVITDTFPFEVPIIFSNDGLYRNFKESNKYKSHLQSLVLELMKNDKYTIPYRYNIVKTPTSSRQLSLIHPTSQKDVCDFYMNYEDLICYYSSMSSFTIRAPKKVGSSFYFFTSVSDKNKYRNGIVDTLEIDKMVRNPASYFAYTGYNRLYKFFKSNDFLRLEKKFSFMISLDVSKCFDSIYTHSIAWAVKDIQMAKQHISAAHFGSDFDKIMQRMNYNETNGICIGAEVSRIFAEIIFCKIDQNIERRLSAIDIKNMSDYEIRRYVDNFYIFTNSQHMSDKIQGCITNSLREFKLNLNENKIEIHHRPFYTKKSKITDDTNAALRSFFSKLIGTGTKENRNFSYPKKIIRYKSLLNSFINEVKSNCYDSLAGYEAVSNYIIPSFAKRLSSIIDDHDLSRSCDKAGEDEYVFSMIMLLELGFFFYAMNPTVASSLSISKCVIISARFFSEKYPDRLPFLQERIVRWTSQLMKDSRLIKINRDYDAIPIEILNILIAMHDIAADHTFSEDAFRRIFTDISKMEYFSLMSCLFIIKNNVKFNTLRTDIFKRIYQIVSDSMGLNLVAHDAHLLLDSLSCPFIPISERVKLYQLASVTLGLGSVSKVRATAAVSECENSPWFVNWRGIALLNSITKKELSSVY